MATNLSLREGVLKFFKKEKIDYIPLFSGMGNITIHGLEKYGWKFPEIHTDARKMANMAASSFQLFGFPCAVVPFDMGVEAEVLGSKVITMLTLQTSSIPRSSSIRQKRWKT